MRDEAAWPPAETNHPFLARGLAKNTGLGFDVVRPLLASADRETLMTLAVRRDLPPDAAETLAAHPDVTVRAELAGTIAARHAWARLAEDQDVGVRRRLASNGDRYRRRGDPSLPEPAAWKLADDPDDEVRRQAALWAPVEAVLHLVADPSSKIRSTLARRRLPEPATRALLTDADPAIRRGALHRETVPPDLVRTLATDPDGHTRANAAETLPLTADLAADLAADPDPWVRENLVANPDLPLPLLLRLADDPDEDVRAAVMLHRDLPTDVQERVEASVEPHHSHLTRWLTPDEAPLALRLEHVDSPFVFFRRAVALSSDLPVDAVHRLAADADHSVRLLLAENHPDTPGDVVAGLIPCGHATWELIKHPSLTVEALTAFAEGDDEYARVPAATSPRLPPSVIVRLLGHTHHNTRVTAAANPALPEPELRRLLSGNEFALVTAAATNPAIPVESARQLVEAILA
ncbi:hypothetical protein [Saccharothrix sp. NRRL B-16314]|uniref:hypothetical protein n=1 Tax=Saccharothrix sp. NRRL B-16314 TaxID=1463825 RepID=UPI0005278285|nr:hypothetical protein [Saccharothrix sp. NRRL B-16314]